MIFNSELPLIINTNLTVNSFVFSCSLTLVLNHGVRSDVTAGYENVEEQQGESQQGESQQGESQVG